MMNDIWDGGNCLWSDIKMKPLVNKFSCCLFIAGIVNYKKIEQFLTVGKGTQQEACSSIDSDVVVN